MTDFFHKIIRFPSLPSTNEKCKELIREKSIEPYSVVVTDNQYEGKGQNGNKWLAEEGLNLTFSLYAPHSNLPAGNQFILNKAVALGLYHAIQSFTPSKCNIKWPNDLFIKDHKVAGILIENQLYGKNIQNSVIGIGINVNQVNFNAVYGNPTSLKLEIGQQLPLESVLTKVLQSLSKYLGILDDHNYALIHEEYEEYLFRKGEECIFETANGQIEAILERVNPMGQLVISTPSGFYNYSHGDIKLLLNDTLY